MCLLSHTPAFVTVVSVVADGLKGFGWDVLGKGCYEGVA
jgi:hypothetical protein